MGSKLFVGGLSWGTTDESLKVAFAEFGEVTEAVVKRDHESGRSRGFGFVTFAVQTEALQALEALNDGEVDGRQIRVSEALSRDQMRTRQTDPSPSQPRV